jgi:phage gpG-like protein
MPQLDTALERAVFRLTLKMVGLVKTKLGGEVLKVRTGRLRRSINFKLNRQSGKIESTVGTNVVYGKTHELGLTIPAHIVEAKRAKALQFSMGGKIVYAKRVNIPAVKMPKRSFLQASLEQMTPEIMATLTQDVANEFRKAIIESAR